MHLPLIDWLVGSAGISASAGSAGSAGQLNQWGSMEDQTLHAFRLSNSILRRFEP
jgi:hypothetical protein